MSPAQIETTDRLTPRFDGAGLVAAIVVAADRGDVLMVAWMTAEALALTRATGEAHFWSRSRQSIWRKGEESGNTLHVVEMRIDCDQDAVLLRVSVGGAGVACHTGARSCFYRRVAIGPDATDTLEFCDAAIPAGPYAGASS